MMLEKVKTKKQDFKRYRGLISEALFAEVKKLARKLRDLKVVHVNSTPEGGGVAEILKTLVPLMENLGLCAEWYTIPGDEEFFDKKFLHDPLQGAKKNIPDDFFDYYLSHLENIAKLFNDIKADVWVIHDPQPAGLIKFVPHMHPAISRFHIDTSSPNKKTFDFFLPILEAYDKIIFSAEDFVCKGIPKDKINIFQPAIDPFSLKNKIMPSTQIKTILKKLGINSKKPLISQISRFDPWKDPIGVLKAYKIAKKKVPELQLVLAGIFLAKDDPGSEKMYKEIKERTIKEKDVFLFGEPKTTKGIDVDIFVNAIQRASNVVLQKSIKEGFGLTVTEAMWKGKVVIGGNIGGIKKQIKNEENGFLVKSPEETAKKIIKIIEDKKLRRKIGRKARESVRENFLMPRLLRDYLSLFREIM